MSTQSLGYSQRHASPTLALHDSLTDDQIEALTDLADASAHASKIVDMRDTLRRLFVCGMESAATARSTARLPITVRYNAADDGEPDRFVHVVRHMPVTVIASEMLETKGAGDNHLHLLIAEPAKLDEMRAAQVRALADEYADAEAEGLVDARWQE